MRLMLKEPGRGPGGTGTASPGTWCGKHPALAKPRGGVSHQHPPSRHRRGTDLPPARHGGGTGGEAGAGEKGEFSRWCPSTSCRHGCTCPWPHRVTPRAQVPRHSDREKIPHDGDPAAADCGAWGAGERVSAPPNPSRLCLLTLQPAKQCQVAGGPPSANGDGRWGQGGKPGGRHDIWRANNAGANLRQREGKAVVLVGTGWRPRSATDPPGDLGPSGRQCLAALPCPQGVPAGSWGQGDMGPSCSRTAAGALSLRGRQKLHLEGSLSGAANSRGGTDTVTCGE